MYADVTVPNDCAHLFIAIDVAAFDPDGSFGGSVDKLVAEIASSALAPGTERVLLPGQLEEERAVEAYASGVPVDQSVIDGLRATARLVGAELAEDLS
jgi:LDH2 family malate/lactate/ureidoglycolate dehydrogenase